MTKTDKQKITNDFWDFIEKYNPDFPNREDFLRQSELQMYVDGHPSELSDELSKDEAEDELHHLLYNIYCRAVDNYSKGIGVECDDCNNHHTKYCPSCGRLTNNDSIEDPYRCEECGSLEIQELAWVDTNTQICKDISLGEEQDRYCNHCEEHTHQLKQSELMESINAWWEELDGELVEIITGIDYDNFANSVTDPKIAFQVACDNYWNTLDVERKISIWKQNTFDNRNE